MGNIIGFSDKETIHIEVPEPKKDESPTGTYIESKQRLQRSVLWDLQEQYYSNATIREWEFLKIQAGISSSAYLARAYANIILSYIHDMSQKEGERNEKVTIIDIGVGCGRLGYYIVQYLLEAKSLWPNPEVVPFLYVMTDCSQKMIKWIEQNRFLEPLINQGLMDVAFYDVENPQNLYLQHSNRMINENALKVPPVIILNNVLSRLKQDIVTIASHGVQMGLVSVFSTQKEYSTSDPSILSRLSCEWHFQSQVRAESNMGWEKDVANTIQRMNEEYRGTVTLVPVRGIPLINRILSYCSSKAVFLIGDEGLCLKDEIIAVKNPTLSFDGGISFPLPFHVFKQHCVDRGGFVATSEYHESYRVMLCAYGLLAETLQQTRLAFRRFILDRSPDGISTLCEELKSSPSFALTSCLLRLTAFDNDSFASLRHAVLSSSPSQALQQYDIHDLRYALAKIRNLVFPFKASQDICFDVARVYMALKDYDKAAELFLLSIRLCGDHHACWYNRGVCLFFTGQFSQARFCFFRALELNNEYEEARVFLRRIYNEDHSLLVEPSQTDAPRTKDNEEKTEPQQEQQESVERAIAPLKEEKETWQVDRGLVQSIQHGEAGVVDELVFSSDSEVESSDEEECIVMEHYDPVSDYHVEYIPSKDDDYEIQFEEQPDLADEV